METQSKSTATPSINELATALADLVAELLPGSNEWPSGRDVGVQHSLQIRYVEEMGEDAVPDLASALNEIGAPFGDLDAKARVAAVQRLESERPGLFGWLRDAAYFAYYESPSVIAQINGRGTPLLTRPHLQGYQLPGFDRAKQTPTHGRGHWIPTDAIQRIDTSGLQLDSKITTKWGLKR